MQNSCLEGQNSNLQALLAWLDWQPGSSNYSYVQGETEDTVYVDAAILPQARQDSRRCAALGSQSDLSQAVGLARS